MRVWAVAILFVYSFWSSVAVARDVRVGDLVLKVSPPSGFCELDQSKKMDSSYFDSMNNLMKASGLSLIAAYPDCGELNKARSTEAFIATRFGLPRSIVSPEKQRLQRPPTPARNRGP